MASPFKRNRAEPSYSQDLAEQIDDETGEPFELPELHYSQEALEEVKEHAMAAKSPEEVQAVVEDTQGVLRARLCQISYWASCTGPADQVYKCTCPYHFGLCQFWAVPNGYKPKAVLSPTPKKWC